jgi:peptide-methionine (S)-S-oxide reductase
MARGSKFVRDLGIFLVLLCIAAVVYSRAATAPVALPNPAVDDTAAASGQQTAVLAGGCFWGIQAVFEHVKGVASVSAGYSGGAAGTANYETVSEGTSGHAESVEITYDPARISYGQLLKVFFSVAHDPTELNRQGPDTGTQYRSAIFYGNESQQRIARAYIDQLNRAKLFPQSIVTQVTPLKGFYRAEAYHQDYLIHHPDNPYIVINDVPKIAHLHQQLPDLYVEKPKAL